MAGLGQQFGIVTRNTSLIVLETIQDYITYNIVPPAELKDEYFRIKKDMDREQRRTERSFIIEATDAMQNLKRWWNIDFKNQKRKYPEPDDDFMETTRESVVENAYIEASMEEVPLELFDAEVMEESANNQEIPPPSSEAGLLKLASEEEGFIQKQEEIIVIASGLAAGNIREQKETVISGLETKNVSQPVIKLTPVKQDNIYTKELTGKLDNDYAVYLKLRPEYIHTPAFYFDMADWFFKHNDRERAILILTSIADLELENASLFRLLGYRLKEYGEYAMEAYVCQKVIQWRPMEPQSYRDYALALADNKNYQAALDSLHGVLTRFYAQNIAGQSNGIEEVIVTEINQLISKHPNLKTGKITKKLIQKIPVDIRVVINWNMNNTDIDLHVTDPNGEICYYSNRETTLGGRISQDITQGYGPEQFLLKKAVKGKYGVFVNYYGDSQVKAEGPSTIMAEIYTRYAGKTEQRQVVCLQLSKENKQENGKVKVAEFSF